MTFVKESLITVLRVVEGELDKSTGLHSESTEQTFYYSGNLQPVTGTDLERLPDGAILSNFKTVFLHDELKPKDIILYKGERFQTEKTEEWDPLFSPIPHYRYIAQLEETL